MGWRDVGFFLRGRLSRTLARALNRHAPPPAPVAPLEDVLRGPVTPLALTRLLEGRDNAARQAAVARWLAARGIPFHRHRFTTFDVGPGQCTAMQNAHRDRLEITAADCPEDRNRKRSSSWRRQRPTSGR